MEKQTILIRCRSCKKLQTKALWLSKENRKKPNTCYNCGKKTYIYEDRFEKQKLKYEKIIKKKVGIINRYKERLKKANELKPYSMNKRLYRHQKAIMKLLGKIDELEKDKKDFKEIIPEV